VVGRGAAASAISAAMLMAVGSAPAGDTSYDLTGRISPQVVVTTYPADSLFGDVLGATSFDSAFDARVVFAVDHGRWNLAADYQLIGAFGEQLELTRDLPDELRGLLTHLPNDRRRLFDLTHVFEDSGKTALLQRLDRLAVGYASDRLVLKFGRQAITWGNGLVYSVMDIFNPFDPSAVDTEYKTGDDMLYGQYLQAGGSDLQGVVVFRRDPVSGDVESDQGSMAFKYHHLASLSEYDALVARHYGDTLIAAGANASIGGSVWRGDVAVTWTDDGVVPSAVTSLSYSWVWAGSNVSGLVEYFYNGFGRGDACYDPQCLAEEPELLARIARGELFTLGRHYLAASATVEMTPLFLVTPSLFVNLRDPSCLLQVLFENNLRQNLLLWSAIDIPVGSAGSEFGGTESAVPGTYLSTGPRASVQLVWYW
jgi:hypothetical protein